MSYSDNCACGRRVFGIGVAAIIGLAPPSAFADETGSPNPYGTSWTPYTSASHTPTQTKESRPRLPYVLIMPVPEGYHIEETPRYGLIAAGVSITASLWLVSTISAIALDREASENGDPNFDDRYWPMFIPVAGPFATIATADSSGTGAAILALDGSLQAVGLAMTIAGFAAPKVELAPDFELTIAPTASSEAGGMSVSGSF